MEKKEDGGAHINISLNLGEKKLKEKGEEDLTIDKNDPLHWKGVVYGPENSPYENGKYDISINFEEDKPNEKPRIQFLTKIYHYTKNYFLITRIRIIIYLMIQVPVMKAHIKEEVVVIFLKGINLLKLEGKLLMMIWKMI